ncbi:uncharacterized protein LOC116339422 [Contarinia nasturtii]|uniref:uncharacterized protein LOC116339422 n=1 Tax=Contarinia nasturtii TaxID=265458 RepID=UPI0012D3CBF5|nr:uncharacterized protein LOC116339422 [Contarinia nasturtii]
MVFQLHVNWRTLEKIKMSSIKIIALFMAILAVISVSVADTRRMRVLVENESPYIMTRSNQTNRPVKFLFDTGASSTFIAKDLLKPNVNIYGQPVRSASCNLDDTPVVTYGMADIFFPRDFDSLKITVNVMDRALIGGEDGLFGFDLMEAFQMIINIPENYIDYEVGEVQRNTSVLTGRRLERQLSRQSSKNLLKNLSRTLSEYYSLSDSE